LGARSRKRGRRTRAPRGSTTTAAPRSAAAPPTATARPRSEERNAAVRAALNPLGPGERPWPIKVAVVIALVLGVVNFVLFLAGAKPHVGGQQPKLPEIIVFSGLMLMCAVGMWLLRYWAVLGFQTLLAIGLLGFCLALVRVSNLLWALVCVVIIVAGGYLFFKLVRVLSRLALPQPPGR
jgi:hypothetical protein